MLRMTPKSLIPQVNTRRLQDKDKEKETTSREETGHLEPAAGRQGSVVLATVHNVLERSRSGV